MNPVLLWFHKLGSPPYFYQFAGKLIPWLFAVAAATGAYGLYRGDTVARDNFPDQIIIFRDTLRRDFGHDPDLLREQVTITVRHELAHHLGADELGVRDLGL